MFFSLQADMMTKTMKVLMWNVSSPMADRLYGVSNWLLLAGAFAVVVGTVGSITMGTVREYFVSERLRANEAAAERAVTDAETANDGATLAHTHIADANKRAAEAERVPPAHRDGRILTDRQASALFAGLKASPKGKVIVKPNSTSAEPIRYADEISAVFKHSGFSEVGDPSLQAVSLPRPGLFFVVRDANRPPAHALPIVNAFHHAQIPMEVAHADWVPNDDVVVILVGARS
jgi:hypothetical protein